MSFYDEPEYIKPEPKSSLSCYSYIPVHIYGSVYTYMHTHTRNVRTYKPWLLGVFDKYVYNLILRLELVYH